MSIEKAVETILQSTGLRPDDRVVIVADQSVMEAMTLLHARAGRLAAHCELLDLDRFGARPLGALPAEVAQALDHCSVCYVAVRAVADAGVNELATIRRPIALYSPKIKHINMPGLTYEVLESAFQSDPREIWELSRKVFEAVRRARQIRVTAENGTDAIFEFSKDLTWINLDGDFRERFVPLGSNNLPGAEVYTCPAQANGTYVVDGVLGDHLAERYGLIEDRPVTYQIRDGRVVEVEGAVPAMADEVRQYMRTDENADRIGEFALGTNPTLERLIGNMLHDEKFPSVHIAAGSPYPHVTGATWDSSAHMDAITLRPTVEVDGRVIMRAGTYVL